MSIAENILSQASIGSDLSQKTELEEYFSTALFDDALWPFDFEKDKVKTQYLCAHIFPDKLGLSEELHLNIRFAFENYHYLLSERISADDSLNINLESIIRQGDIQNKDDRFVYHLLEKHQKFIKEYTHKNNLDPNDAQITIHAHSGVIDGAKTAGGYVWATYGFEFKDAAELNRARTAFQHFAKEHNVLISDKDLKYFKYPCHFAAFDTGDQINGNSLGKAFLLSYEWFGVQKADISEKSEVFKYQKAYHEKSKEAATSELSKSYLAVLNKYKHQNKQKTNILGKISLLKNKLLQRYS